MRSVGHGTGRRSSPPCAGRRREPPRTGAYQCVRRRQDRAGRWLRDARQVGSPWPSNTVKRARIRSGRPAIGYDVERHIDLALQAMFEIVLRTAMTQHHHFIDHRFSPPRSLAVCHTHLSTTPRMAAWRFLSRLGRSSPNTAVKMCVMWPCTPSMMATWMCRSRWSKLPAGSALHSSYLTGRPMMLIFPPQVPMEQCSSQFTAQYKARLAQRLLAEEAVDDDSPTSLVDLTGGFGVDFSYMSRVFNRAIYVEQQSILCDIARHNFPILGLDHAEVINDDSTAVLDTLGRVSMIFLDPARRDDHARVPTRLPIACRMC